MSKALFDFDLITNPKVFSVDYTVGVGATRTKNYIK